MLDFYTVLPPSFGHFTEKIGSTLWSKSKQFSLFYVFRILILSMNAEMLFYHEDGRGGIFDYGGNKTAQYDEAPSFGLKK